MTIVEALLTLVVLLVITVIAGVVARSRQNRLRRSLESDVVQPRRLGADALGEAATLLQFSTEMCGRCPGAHRMLSAIADGREGVIHLDVDLTHRPDIAKHFQVLQTPTTLILDGAGAIQSRIGGVPQRAVLELELDRLREVGARD